MSKLIITTDLGTFRAFRLEKEHHSSSPRIEPVDAFETIYGDDRISRRLSDQAGQFGKGAVTFAAINDGANGERHNIQLEDRRRSVRLIAKRMNELLEDNQFESCYFAAANEINNTILGELAPEARAKIKKNLTCNLVNVKEQELIERFERQ